MRLTEELHPDAIFMDLIMPGTNGLALCRALREQRQWRGPIIAVSANVFESDRERATASGCDGFVGKPVHLRALLEQLQLHLLLKWVHGGDAAIINPEADEFPAIPPVDRLLTIREHARVGYVRGISEEIERLSALDPLYGRYAARLHELARQFRTSEIETLIEKTLSHEYNRTQA
jgi:hypothetical protein